MPAQINLLIKKEGARKPTVSFGARTKSLFGGSILLFFLVILAAGGFFVYQTVLQKESDTLASEITTLEKKVESLREIEEKKSLLTMKTEEIRKLYESRFDYVKAIDDVQKLFAYSLRIETVKLDETRDAEVKAKKTGEIVISETEALATDIEELVLTLILPSSEQLQQTVDNLKFFLGKGLASADVISSLKLDSNEGYEVKFRLTFESRPEIAESAQPAGELK